MSPGNGRLKGKVALITGGASGIGYATAERFVAEGATVIITDRARDELNSAYVTICGGREPHRALSLDVTIEENWRSATAEVEAAYGRLDVLVNNAGYGRPGSIEATSLEEWRKTIAVNLDGVFLGTKYFLPLLARSGKSAVVNISSIIGLVASVNGAAYAAAKAGVHSFTKATALECAAARNCVRANSVHPGQIETPLLARNMAADPDKARASILNRIPLGRMGRPREIAEAIVFLASDESSFMTGAELILDGGYTAQ